MCQGERGDEALVFKSTLFSLVTLHSQCTTGPLIVRICGRLFGLAIKADVSRARSLSLSGPEICFEKSNV